MEDEVGKYEFPDNVWEPNWREMSNLFTTAEPTYNVEKSLVEDPLLKKNKKTLTDSLPTTYAYSTSFLQGPKTISKCQIVKTEPISRRRWTVVEEKILASYKGKVNINWHLVSRQIGRSVGAVKARFYNHTIYQREELGEGYP